MRAPNFSESQFQQAVNTAFIQQIFRTHGEWSFAHVPSLIAEFELGWDTAFYFPWLPHRPSPEHEGCNFFVQYKLSGELTSRGALEWSDWNSPYFRFRIPHSTRDRAGAFIDDYHQWDGLKALATKGYPTFYATNTTLQRAVLQSQLQSETLLDEVAAMDVRRVAAQHKHVSFTPTSSHFVLHSEKEERTKITLSKAIELASEAETLSLGDSIRRLVVTLQELPVSDEFWRDDLARLTNPAETDFPQFFRYWVRYGRLRYFIRKHVGADLLWLPRRGV